MRVTGYCELCRRKEVELFGSVLNTAGPRHARACREAGCRHPPWYNMEREPQNQPDDNSHGRVTRRPR
jgi:hypothetical protein